MVTRVTFDGWRQEIGTLDRGAFNGWRQETYSTVNIAKRERQVAGYQYVNESSPNTQRQLPGGAYLNEATIAVQSIKPIADITVGGWTPVSG